MHVIFAVLLFVLSSHTYADTETESPYYFGVINQRSISLTAKYWNPILAYISNKTDVPLRLKMGKTAPETTAMTVRGEHAFVYTNHMFTRERDKLGYQVILRLQSPAINSVIIVRKNSPINHLMDLNNQLVIFPSREAFVGYWVPMDHIMKSGIKVKQTFAGNQEGAMAQLQAGRGQAAAVNKLVLERYARREQLKYRILWESEPYLSIPVMANPKLPAELVQKVRNAFIDMTNDSDGNRILKQSADLLKQKRPLVFIRADDNDYKNYRDFYKNTVIQ